MEPSKPRRRWFRFRLRTLLVMVTALSVPLGWVGWELDQRRKEKKIIALIEEMGGGVGFFSEDYKSGLFSDERSWWEKKKDNWFGERAWHVRLQDISDTQMNDLMSPLAGLKNLKWLQLESTQVSDLSPLAKLKNLEKLQWLELYKTQVGDLSPLAELKNLQWLYLRKIQVTDLSQLAELENLNSLTLESTRLSDLSPLAELEKLEKLKFIWVKGSDEQLQELIQALPNCKIETPFSRNESKIFES